MSKIRPKMICKACGNINKSTQSIFSLRCQKCGGELMLLENAWFGTRDTKLLRMSYLGRYVLIVIFLMLSLLVTNMFYFVIECVIIVVLFHLLIFIFAKIRGDMDIKPTEQIKKIGSDERKIFIDKKGELKWVEKKQDFPLITFLLLAIAIIFYDVSQLIKGYSSLGVTFFFSSEGLIVYHLMILFGTFVCIVGFLYMFFVGRPIKLYELGVELPFSYYHEKMRKRKVFIPLKEVVEISPMYRNELLTKNVSFAGILLKTYDSTKHRLLLSRNYPIPLPFTQSINSKPLMGALKEVIGKKWEDVYREKQTLNQKEIAEIERYARTSPIIRIFLVAFFSFGLGVFLMIISPDLFPILAPTGLVVILIGVVYILKYEDKYTLYRGSTETYFQTGSKIKNQNVMR